MSSCRWLFLLMFTGLCVPLQPGSSVAYAEPVKKAKQAERGSAIKIEFEFVRSTKAAAKKHAHVMELLDAGGMVIAAPCLTAQNNVAVSWESLQHYPYLVKTCKPAQPFKVSWVAIGLSFQATPHEQQNGTIRLDISAENVELLPTNPPTWPRYGVITSCLTPIGKRVVVGTWTQQNQVITIFARSTRISRHRVSN